MILVGKGVASGYAPLGGVLIAPRVAEAFARGSGTFKHGFTYQAHPVAMAAGLAVLEYATKHKIFERVAPASEAVFQALEPLGTSPHVGEIRGRGLLLGVEFVQDAKTREPFAPEKNIAERVFEAAFEAGVAMYPIQGCVDGACGDHVLLAPPFIISPDEVAKLAGALSGAVQAISKGI
jgi:adenosylmethionine-8-amino-7-oxononanoate aminotransferase